MCRRQRIGFVDKQHAIERSLDRFARLNSGLSDIAGDKAAAIDLDDMP